MVVCSAWLSQRIVSGNRIAIDQSVFAQSSVVQQCSVTSVRLADLPLEVKTDKRVYVRTIRTLQRSRKLFVCAVHAHAFILTFSHLPQSYIRIFVCVTHT